MTILTTARLRLIPFDETHLDGLFALNGDPVNPLEIGWRHKPSHWHRGYAIEAARAMAAFELTDVLYAVCDPENTASAQVMQRLGMAYQGIQRWYPADTATYSLSKEQLHYGE